MSQQKLEKQQQNATYGITKQQQFSNNSETIQLSSDDEQPAATAVTPSTCTTAGNIYESCNNSAAAYERSTRRRTRSRSHSHGSSSSSISLSSTLSSSYRSLDYEAEADEEDANECEGVELQRKLAGGNDNLMHVQNFLNCFDTQQRRKQRASTIGGTTQPLEQQQQQQMVRQRDEQVEYSVAEHLLPTDEIKLNYLSSQRSPNELIARNHFVVTDITKATEEVANVSAEMTTEMTSTVATKATTHKSGKFTISTKFLRKPRHKLKSVSIAPTADVHNVLVAAATMVGEKVAMLQPPRIQESEYVSQQQQRQQQQQKHQQPSVDEPNVKFNSNFSISSLLNKR